jgi:hypothetical protein
MYVVAKHDRDMDIWCAFVKSCDTQLHKLKSIAWQNKSLPYFLIDKAHLMYNAHPKLFDIPFDV